MDYKAKPNNILSVWEDIVRLFKRAFCLASSKTRLPYGSLVYFHWKVGAHMNIRLKILSAS